MASWPQILACGLPGCDWHIDQTVSVERGRQENQVALAEHRVAAHPSLPRGDGRDEWMSRVCPFKDESMRAAFMVGWLARGNQK